MYLQLNDSLACYTISLILFTKTNVKMDKPKVAQTTPYAVEVEANKKYAWCSCVV